MDWSMIPIRLLLLNLDNANPLRTAPIFIYIFESCVIYLCNTSG